MNRPEAAPPSAWTANERVDMPSSKISLCFAMFITMVECFSGLLCVILVWWKIDRENRAKANKKNEKLPIVANKRTATDFAWKRGSFHIELVIGYEKNYH